MTGLKCKGAERALTTAVPQGGCYRFLIQQALGLDISHSCGFRGRDFTRFFSVSEEKDRIVHQLGRGQILSTSSVPVPSDANSVDTGNTRFVRKVMQLSS